MFIFGIFPLLQQPEVSSHFMLQLCAKLQSAQEFQLCFPKTPLHTILEKEMDLQSIWYQIDKSSNDF